MPLQAGTWGVRELKVAYKGIRPPRKKSGAKPKPKLEDTELRQIMVKGKTQTRVYRKR